MGLDCILLIDDDISANYLHQTTIRSSGLDQYIHVTRSAEAALDFLTYNNVYKEGNELPRPGLIFLDIALPRMNAWDFINEYRNLPNDIKDNSVIVLLSNSEEEEIKDQIEGYPEVRTFLQKPLTQKAITNIVSEFFN